MMTQGVDVINSAVFNGGFLTGGAFFDYREVKRETDPELFAWRDKFNAVCAEFGEVFNSSRSQFVFQC